MVLEMLDKVIEASPDSPELETAVVQQVSDIVKHAEQEAETAEPETAHWFYSVPFAGVRYYSF